jgi:CRP-like cAMP-binding protein
MSNYVLDPDSIVLQAIAGLCAKGLPPENAEFLQSIHPLLVRVAAWMAEDMPPQPEVALILWLLKEQKAPKSFSTTIAEHFGVELDEDEEDVPVVKSALKSSAGMFANGKEGFISPSGTPMSEERLRRVAPLLDHQKREFVMHAPVFQSLSSAEVDTLCEALDLEKYLEGEEIQKNGVAVEGLHIIVKGEAKVVVTQDVSVLKRGDIFGHQELLQGLVANETVEASNGPVTTLSVSGLVLKHLGLKKKLGAMSRKKAFKVRDHTEVVTDVGSGRCSSEDVQYAEKDEDLNLIKEAINKNQNLKEVVSLSGDQLDALARSAYKRFYDKKANVLVKGDLGDTYMVVNEGIFEVIDGDIIDDCSKTAFTMRAGDSFGELCIMYNAPRAATVKCVRAGSVWTLSRACFKTAVRQKLEGRLADFGTLCKNCDIFANISPQILPTVCNALEERTFYGGEVIVRQGAVADFFYIISEGECTVIVDDEPRYTLVRGHYFGERGLISHCHRDATVVVKTDQVVVLSLDKTAFQLLMHQNKQVENQADGNRHGSNAAGIGEWSNVDLVSSVQRQLAEDGVEAAYRSVPLDALTREGVLGRGAFGFVTLERDNHTGQLYALKAQSKGHIVQEKLKNMVTNEAACMGLLRDSDFIVKLVQTYRDGAHVYLLLEPCFGGELFDVYSEREELFGDEAHAKFYTACVALGLDHMHSRKIIYRDLKLENCLLTLTGYLKLTDLGLGKVCIGKTYTVCGTTDYFAPETLRQTGHNRAVDWWALGVMVYIIMTGSSPFDAPDTMKIYRKITKGFAKVVFPSSVPERTQEFIKGLCQKVPEERITMGTMGIQNLKDHPWYRGFDWRHLEMLTLAAPSMPAITEDQIIAKAQTKTLEALPQIPYEDDGTDWDACFDYQTFSQQAGAAKEAPPPPPPGPPPPDS